MRKTNKILYRKIPLPFKIKKPVLAMGSQTKNTICFAKGGLAILSPIHTDLSNPEDFLNFEKDVKYFLKRNPKVIACDLHPEYQSTKYIYNSSLSALHCQLVQHHHAHIASCMLDNGLKNQKVIGVAFDGTGSGSNNRLWGAEFLVCDYKNFTRSAYLREIPLLGGESAIAEPWRVAALWLYLAYKEKFLNLGINFVKGIPKNKWQVLKKMYLAGFNSPLASSMGRLFDAVASMVLEKYQAGFEAELAIELEKKAAHCTQHTTGYNFKIIKKDNEYIIDPLPMFKEIVSDLRRRETPEKIAYGFHASVAEMIKKICLILRQNTRINTIVLSGGVFQNNLLLSLSLDLLYKEGFKAVIHKNLSCNDSGISLGQAVIADFKD
jgi:hydrogenase maturation protein HypF